MKRRFALTLAAVLILTLAVCGGGIENIPGGREHAWEASVTLQTEMLAAAEQLLWLLFAKPLAAIDRALERLGMGYIERRLAFTILTIPFPYVPWYGIMSIRRFIARNPLIRSCGLLAPTEGEPRWDYLHRNALPSALGEIHRRRQ